MIMLLGSTSGAKLRAEIEGRSDIGIMHSPDHWLRPWCPFYACDNGAFAHREDTEWWEREGESNWLRMLDKIPSAHRPLFVVLPDVVGDWDRTLARSWYYREELRSRGLPAAIALQDGCDTPADYAAAEALHCDAVFVGGTTRWKLAHAQRLRAQFWREWFHVGRASGWRRVRWCREIGADSCDGTGWRRNPGREMPKLFWALDGTHPQQCLPI